MPFRKRKKEAEKQKRFETRHTNEHRIEDAIAEAEKITEPGEKLLKVEKILADINRVLRSEEYLITSKGYDASGNAVAGGMFSAIGMLVGGVATISIAPPVGLGMVVASLPTAVAGLPLSPLREKAVTKKFNAEAKDHLQTLADYKQTVTGMKEELVAYIIANKSEILLSPVYEEVSKLPDLSDELKGLAAQELAKYREMQSAAKEAPAKTPKLTNKPKIVLSRPPQA